LIRRATQSAPDFLAGAKRGHGYTTRKRQATVTHAYPGFITHRQAPTIDLCPFPGVNFDRRSSSSPVLLWVLAFPNSNTEPIDRSRNRRAPKLPSLWTAPRARPRLKIANFANDFRAKK